MSGRAWLPDLRIAVLAFVAMCVQDIAGTAMVVAEAHLNALVSAACDELQWTAGLICTLYGLADVIRERRITRRSVVAFVAISAGNVIGTAVGVDVLGRLLTAH